MNISRVPTPFSPVSQHPIFGSSEPNSPVDTDTNVDSDTDESTESYPFVFRPICPEEGRISPLLGYESVVSIPKSNPATPINSPTLSPFNEASSDEEPEFLKPDLNRQIVPAHFTNSEHIPIQILFSTIFQIHSEEGPDRTTETEIRGFPVETIEIVNTEYPLFRSPPFALRTLRGKSLHVVVEATGEIAMKILPGRSLTPLPKSS